jgi:hypothetical protein
MKPSSTASAHLIEQEIRDEREALIRTRQGFKKIKAQFPVVFWIKGSKLSP